jgi:hypothetical protein
VEELRDLLANEKGWDERDLLTYDDEAVAIHK